MMKGVDYVLLNRLRVVVRLTAANGNRYTLFMKVYLTGIMVH